MFSNKVRLATLALLLSSAALPAYAQQAAGQDASATDFSTLSKQLQSVTKPDADSKATPAKDAKTAPMPAASKSDDAAPIMAPTGLPQAPILPTAGNPGQSAATTQSTAPVLMPAADSNPIVAAPQAATDDGADLAASVPAVGGSGDYLKKVHDYQRDNLLKSLELQGLKTQAEIDKLTGAAAEKEAELQAAINGHSEKAQEPVDDTSTLPGVSAILGAHGVREAALSLPGGGTITAKVGDMLPGNWKLSRIERSSVYVKSPRSGEEFVLGSSSSASSSRGSQASRKQAPKVDAPKVTPTSEGNAAPIMLAPANE